MTAESMKIWLNGCVCVLDSFDGLLVGWFFIMDVFLLWACFCYVVCFLLNDKHEGGIVEF